ncbi:MAG: hypothetical protein ABSD47_19945 [Candidatus Methylomirabilota bacterium]|jgi:hypothetical protein
MTQQAAITTARAQDEKEGESECDDQPQVSMADPKRGADVHAWVWVSADEG